MNPQEHNMAVLGQIVKLIPKKLIEKQVQNSNTIVFCDQSCGGNALRPVESCTQFE